MSMLSDQSDSSNITPFLRVHIALVGHDLVDRIVLPIKNLRADRVYLISKSKPNIFADKVDEVKKILVNEYRIKSRDVYVRECDIFDFLELSKTIAAIAGEEKKEKNHIYYNISCGGSLNGAIGLLLCMLLDISPYFIKKDFKAQSIPEPLDFIKLPEFSLEKPERTFVQLIEKMKAKMLRLERDYLYKKEILEIIPIIDEEITKDELLNNPTSSRLYNLLNSRYLNKMVKNDLISIERKRNGKVKITQKGGFILEVFSSYFC